MNPEGTALRFFLGSNTPQGFVSRFDQLANADDGWRCFVIKGGPGSGKSTIIKRVGDRLLERGLDIEYIHCASDVDSLDGVICPSLKLCVADGTPPHVIEPKYPGAFETVVDLTSCWDDEILYANRDDIIALSKGCSRCHDMCCRYLGAAGALAGDSYRIALDCVNQQKLNGYCKRLTERELRPGKDRAGKEHIRMFSAVTNKGVVSFPETAKLMCRRLYLINDEHGAVSRIVLQYIKGQALAAGYDVIASYCPLSPFEKLEYLFIPESGAGFLTSNVFHDYGLRIDPYRIINSRRFTNQEQLKRYRKRLTFNRKAQAQMVAQAEILLKEAGTLHDELEEYYIQATDYTKVEALTEKLMDKIERV
jgi:hypothetical protein